MTVDEDAMRTGTAFLAALAVRSLTELGDGRTGV